MGNLKAKDSGEVRELIPAGSYRAIICGVYDLGTQPGGQYGPKHQILIQFELHKRKGPARNAKGDIFTTSNFYTLSFNEKANLRAHVEAIEGRSFTEDEISDGYDVEQLLGKSCRLQIVHGANQKGDTRAKIQAISALDPEEDDVPEPQLDGYYYEIGGETPLKDIPEWIQKIVANSRELGGKAGSNPNGAPKRATVPPDDEEDDSEDILY